MKTYYSKYLYIIMMHTFIYPVWTPIKDNFFYSSWSDSARFNLVSSNGFYPVNIIPRDKYLRGKNMFVWCCTVYMISVTFFRLQLLKSALQHCNSWYVCWNPAVYCILYGWTWFQVYTPNNTCWLVAKRLIF